MGRTRSNLGEHDGRVAMYLADGLHALLPPSGLQALSPPEGRAQRIVEFLASQGASFFAAVHQAAGGGFPGETSDALWQLAWQGVVTNDTFQCLRGFLQRQREGRTRRGSDFARPGSAEFLKQFRARSGGGAVAQGRWSLVRSRYQNEPTITEWSASVAQQLLLRYGVVTRESAAAEELPGGFSALYPALRQMEDRGWIRRGMFLSGLGGSQFASNAAVEASARVALSGSEDGGGAGGRGPGESVWQCASVAAALRSRGIRGGIARHGAHQLERACCWYRESWWPICVRGNPAIKLWLPDSQPARDEYARLLLGSSLISRSCASPRAQDC